MAVEPSKGNAPYLPAAAVATDELRPPDAGRRCASLDHRCRRPKTCTGPDSCTATNTLSLDHLVGAKQERLWDCEAKRFGGLEVDDQRKLGRLLNWKVCGLFAAEDTIDV
jgi:hypothetical protein